MEQAIVDLGLTIFIGLFLVACAIILPNLWRGAAEEFYRSDNGIIIKKSTVEAIDTSHSEFTKIHLSSGVYITIKTDQKIIRDWFTK